MIPSDETLNAAWQRLIETTCAIEKQAADDLSDRLVEQMQKDGMLHAFTDTVSAVAANAPAYEPLELVCGSYSSSEKPQRYLLADVRRWAKGDFADLHSTPREVIATLAETVMMLLCETTLTPIPDREWILDGYRLDVGLSCWVELRGTPERSLEEELGPEQFVAWLKTYRPWVGIIGDQPISTPRLSRWARGDQRDLYADAVTAMRALAGEVLRLAGLEE